MSLMGIDAGTTGCKVSVFSEKGNLLSFSYEEYDVERPRPEWAELDSARIWKKIRSAIKAAASQAGRDKVKALSVSSLGEAVVPVSRNRTVLGPSILNFDTRGYEYLEPLRKKISVENFYKITGNAPGNQYGLTKILWLRDYKKRIYENAYKLLPWGSFISFMLGAEPAVDYSLANRLLLFDIQERIWSDKIITSTGLDVSKLPEIASSGTDIGRISGKIAAETGLHEGVRIISGAHDQCANAVGCGVIRDTLAVYGIGTFICITPVFTERKNPKIMIEKGLDTEHHAVPDKYVSFIYNQGGSLVKWFRDTFAAKDRDAAEKAGKKVYSSLFSEIPAADTDVFVLPYFTATGTPDFLTNSKGLISGLDLCTSRGDILKGILEGTTFYLKECVESSVETGIEIEEYRPVGGGSISDTWVQICADIMGKPFVRPKVTEAGALGAAMIAGKGIKAFGSFNDAVFSMVKEEKIFKPRPEKLKDYRNKFSKYLSLRNIYKSHIQKS